MDAELIAIQRVRKAVAGLPDPAQFRVLQYVVQGLFEVEQERQRTEPGRSLGQSVARMSEARETRPVDTRQQTN